MRRNISVPYNEKDDAKELGAKWDPVERTWYIHRPNQISDEVTHSDRVQFQRWLKDTPKEEIVSNVSTKWCPTYVGSNSVEPTDEMMAREKDAEVWMNEFAPFLELVAH